MYSKDCRLLCNVKRLPISLIKGIKSTTFPFIYLWLRFWIFATGFEHQERLWKQLLLALKYRKYQTSLAHKYSKPWLKVYSADLRILFLLFESAFRLIKSLLVPHLFMRYLWATSVLHVVYEISSIMKSILKKNFLRITSNGRATIQLSRQIEIAETFTERQAIAFRLDKLQGKDQWRQNPESNLYLYDRVLKKTRMYKVRRADSNCSYKLEKVANL